MIDYSAAVQDFKRARSRAAMQELMARLTGRSIELLSYEDVRQSVRASGVVSRSLREIPLQAIIGSVGRYQDFTRDFLPRRDSDQDRWARVKVATLDMSGLPPIEVYQIGDTYFVHDGHHRLSVARQEGAKEVQAYVTEIRSKVPLSPDIRPDELIAKAEYAEFLAQTDIDRQRPEADLEVTCAGQYEKLLEHIEVHRYYMGIEQQREIPYEEAAVHWFDTVYLPVIDLVCELAMLDAFPGRTEADLYLWVAKHRADIKDSLGWEIPYSAAALDLSDKKSPGFTRAISRIGKRVLDLVIPDELEGGPALGAWRRERALEPPSVILFSGILVALSGDEVGWSSLEQAIGVAQQEGGRLRGLYVVDDQDEVEGEAALAIRDRFYWRCGEVAIPAEFTVEVGPVSRTVCRIARWADLVVVNLAHPPQTGTLSRLSSGFRTLVKHCSRPVLAIPGRVTPLARPLLAYDGSPKAQEALYVATYVSGQWQVPLTVISVTEGDDDSERMLAEARAYLEEHGIEANYMGGDGQVAESILEAASQQESDLILIGGYGANRFVDLVLGSVVDDVLRGTTIPLLICK